jgi:CheY-like chemotaxis protein/two-component sensor histidine kinase
MHGDLTGEQMKQVRFIESSARDLQEMVNDLLDLAKVEAGKIRIRPKRFEVHELFSALKGMLKPLLADNNSVELSFEDLPELPVLHTDEGKVSQILRNLISNALKFTPMGHVIVSARSEGDGMLLFSVADTGIGIPKEHHETVFREFSQIENPLQERHRGTGLGLPLCRNLSMLLGGTMWLESEPDQTRENHGSTFYVRIPAVYVGEAAGAENADNLPAPEFHRTPILVLESNPETARVLESYLRNTEFQPILAGNVALAEVWTARHTPAAVVSDIYLGDDQAWGFLARLQERLPEVPIIITSIYEESEAAMAHGANVFLSKPVDRIVLLRELRRLTAQTGTRRLLLVDDNDVARYILREILDQAWLEIEEASTGTAALASIRENPPDALILDLLMPDMSGFDVLRELRSEARTQGLPVLIYTSKVLSDTDRMRLEGWQARVVRKENVSTRLSARPFLDWLEIAGVAPTIGSAEPKV